MKDCLREHLASGKLTKSFYISVPPGAYLVVPHPSLKRLPVFSETVQLPDGKDKQWQRVRSSHAAYRRAVVFRTEDDYRASSLVQTKDHLVLAWELVTKRFFMGLDEGVFLVSAPFIPFAGPCYAEVVEPEESREEQWSRVRKSEAARRYGIVFASPEDYARWWAWFLALQRVWRDRPLSTSSCVPI